jgi:prepilin-type N-terminal cleavage/methylation domain-containing protein
MPRDRREAGFSLIEVIVSLGLLGSVLLGVAGMFILGERQVRRGRIESVALTAAQTILEDIGGWNHAATWERFGLSGSAATYSIDTQVNTFAQRWQPRLHELLADGRAEIRVESCDGADLVDTDAVRVVVTVFWTEAKRARRTELALVRS